MRNDVIPDAHFHKNWQLRVKTWFNQPARKQRRRDARATKAARLFPRPTAGALRPSVNGQTVKYSFKQKLGRGFTIDELKEAGINRHQASSIGIAVDHRRRNHSVASLKRNVRRLQEYKSKLLLFPRNAKKVKQGEATAEQTKNAQQFNGEVNPLHQRRNKSASVKKSEVNSKQRPSAFTTLKTARSDAKLVGVRKVRAAKKAEQAALAAAKEAK